jgi:mRNA interferase MazF
MLRPDADLFRLDVLPTEKNGLRAPSQLAVDKVTVVPVLKLGPVIGIAEDSLLSRVNRALALFLGIV